jgi:tetratricopeptide (TPR) repeat protein
MSMLFSCKNEQPAQGPSYTNKEEQQKIIDETLRNASSYSLYSPAYQKELDKGLAKDATIAYLWQQKSMPLYKQGKYELGKPFLDKAVQYNRERYLDYRAFMKCIFAKEYREAIIDFNKCIDAYGNSYVMDHTYKCYIGISYIMLNEFETAEAIFKEDIRIIENEKGDDWVHPLELFYYGISLYEQKKHEDALLIFDRAIKKYPTFSDVQFYKSLSFAALGKHEKARELMNQAISNARLGNTINEDNVIYERYPYQVRLKTFELYENH